MSTDMIDALRDQIRVSCTGVGDRPVALRLVVTGNTVLHNDLLPWRGRLGRETATAANSFSDSRPDAARLSERVADARDRLSGTRDWGRDRRGTVRMRVGRKWRRKSLKR